MTASAHTNAGRWRDKETPKNGWFCHHIEDLGEDHDYQGFTADYMVTCEMCLAAKIRFVHYMRHPHISETLKVGHVCAGKMENDAPQAKKRDVALRNRSARMHKWLTATWAQTKKGDDKRDKGDYAFVIHKEKNSWRFSVRLKSYGIFFKTPNKYLTSKAAKKASFLWLEEKLKGNHLDTLEEVSAEVEPKVIASTLKLAPATALWKISPSNGSDFSMMHPDDVLHHASVNIQLERVIELLEMGVPAGQCNVYGMTPLLCVYAKTQNNLVFSDDAKVIIRLLLACGPLSETIEDLVPVKIRPKINDAKFTHWLNKFVVPTRDKQVQFLFSRAMSKLKKIWSNKEIGFKTSAP